MEVVPGLDRCAGSLEITPAFASPEQQQPEAPYTCAASDIYA